MNSPFSPPPRARAAEALAAVKVLARELSPLTAASVLAGAAVSMGPLRDQLRQETRPATAEADTVDQAIAWSIGIYRQLQRRLGRWRAEWIAGRRRGLKLAVLAGVNLLLPAWAQGIAVLLLIGLHVYAERASITKLIERAPALNWLDRLWRSG